jgi:hypothetical protein
MTISAKDVKFRYITHNGERIFDVGILADGSVHNPNGLHSDELVREAVLAAIERYHQYCSERAKRAAVTRAKRREQKIYDIAKRILEGWQVGPRNACAICGKGMSDPPSIERGIGPECWEAVLSGIESVKRREADRLPQLKEEVIALGYEIDHILPGDEVDEAYAILKDGELVHWIDRESCRAFSDGFGRWLRDEKMRIAIARMRARDAAGAGAP